MVNFETWLFSHLPQYFKDFDTYKDTGSGILERFVGTLGKHWDEDIIPMVQTYLDIHNPLITDAIYLTHIAWVLGNPPDTFYDETSYRKLLKYILDINKVKGTALSYELLFGIMGLQVTLTEHSLTPLLYDSGLNYDSDEYYDLNCPPCSGYDLTLTDPDDLFPILEDWETNPELAALLNALIKYVEPINARMMGFNYVPGLVITPIKYGLLYNWYAATDVRKITSSDTWVMPSFDDYISLRTYIEPSASNTVNTVGGKLKETGFIYFSSPNTGASNLYNFNARGGGYRDNYNGSYSFINSYCRYNTTTRTSPTGTGQRFAHIDRNNAVLSLRSSASINLKMGVSARLFRTATSAEQLLADGTACAPYTGNDGKNYRTVKIGTQVWLADNLAETKFRNGDYIHGFDGGVYTPISNAAWAALTTAGVCAYNDDLSNALIL